MKKLILLLFFIFGNAYAEIRTDELRTAGTLFFNGRYEEAVKELSRVESRLLNHEDSFRKELGFVFYWKGLSYNRLGRLENAEKSFQNSFKYDYAPVDIHYEYGQTLFALKKWEDSRLQFRESLKRKFKRGVSLYYISLISKEMGETKKAFTFLNSIQKINDSDFEEVKQASELLIGDLYLEQAAGKPNNISLYVIPQYRKALRLNPKSDLAETIEHKILELEYKYDLQLFNMKNGRAVAEKPYLLRLRQEFGSDSNVFYSAQSVLPKNKESSFYSTTDVIGQYIFYPNNSWTLTPELRLNGSYYFNRKPEIYRNDNFYFSPRIVGVYEHTLLDRPGGLSLEYRYDEAQRDVQSRKSFDLSYRAHHFVLSERLQIFSSGETVFRVGHQVGWSYKSEFDLKENFVSLEQNFEMGKNNLAFFLDYRSFRFGDSIYNVDALTLAGTFYIWDREDFSPALTLGLTRSDPVKDRLRRGQENLWFTQFDVTKAFNAHWSSSLRASFEENRSKLSEDYSYSKFKYSLSVDYLF